MRERLRAHLRPLARAAAALVLAALSLTGWLTRLDDTIGDLRFRLWQREPSGGITLVDIDAASLAAVGTWPWSRTVHARIVDRLRELDAESIVLDIDFSAVATSEGDAALEAALRRADGSVVLAALQQAGSAASAGDGEAGLVANHPLPRFAAQAWEASADVRPDADGVVRRLALDEDFGGARLPAMAALLASSANLAGEPFRVDFGILASGIDHVSATDLLEGRVARGRIAGRRVLVGANALELHDYVRVPRYGLIPGPTFQAVAAESLMGGRALHGVDPRLMLLAAGLALAGAAAAGARLTLRGQLALLVCVGAAGEAAATAVQNWLPLVPGTAPLHAGLLCFALIAVGCEVDDRRVAVLRSRAEADRLRAILDRVIADNFTGIVVVDHDGAVRAVSAAAADIIGLPAGLDDHSHHAEVLPGPLSALCAEALAGAAAGTWRRRPAGEVDCALREGSPVTLDCVVTLSRVPGPVGPGGRPGAERHAVCLSFADVTEKRAAEARLLAMARIDALTGLCNRHVLLDGIAEALGGGDASRTALVVFDLEGVKLVNDRLGHASGDALLASVADRVRAALEPGDLAARLGGDEFAVLISRPAGVEPLRFAEALLAAVGGTHEIGPYQATVGVSAGVAVAGKAAAGAQALMRDADVALSAAKRAGGGLAVLFDAALERGAEADRALEHDLRDALGRDEILVFYQRQVDLGTDAIVGVEALARWRHPERGFVSPAVFIPIAERTGLIESLGAFVLRTACRDAASWPMPIKMSVNLSAVQLQRDDLADTVLAALAETGLPAARLDLELTESLLMQNDGTAGRQLERLRSAGIHLSLDDFGTGYSSLSYLRSFAIDKVKIDQSFVRGLPADRPAAAIIAAVVGLAGSLGLRVNAEGCETAEQLDLLRTLGCHEVQGWFHGRPEPAPAIVASLLAQRGEGPIRGQVVEAA